MEQVRILPFLSFGAMKSTGRDTQAGQIEHQRSKGESRCESEAATSHYNLVSDVSVLCASC